jgi:hypothetical protein
MTRASLNRKRQIQNKIIEFMELQKTGEDSYNYPYIAGFLTSLIEQNAYQSKTVSDDIIRALDSYLKKDV